MNKTITFLVLVVVLAAMGLVFFTQMQSTPDSRQASDSTVGQPGSVSVGRDGRMNPLQGQQGDSGGLTPIDPPLAGVPGDDGVPKPVTVAAGQDPRTVRVIGGQPEQQDSGTPDGASPADAPTQTGDAQKAGQNATASGRTPSLTPWELPPKDDAKKAETKKEDAKKAAEAKKKEKAAADKAKKEAAAKAKAEEKKAAKAKAEEKAAQAKSKEPALSDKAGHSLKSISLAPAGQSMRLRIEADSDFPCKTFVLTGPDRLVIDLPGTWKGVKAPSVPQNLLVKSARKGDQPAGPRLVLDLSKPIKGHKVERSGNVVEIVLQ